MSSTHPRERLVKTAANLVHRQGWTITGINQILTEAGIPKGSFYYYFRSKEALGVAVLQHHHTILKGLLERTLLNDSLTPESAVGELVREVVSGPLAEDFKFGCPAGNLAGEIATQCPALLTEANRSLDLYRDAWTTLIRRGQKSGEIHADLDAADLGHTAMMLLQGAFLSAKCSGRPEALETAHGVYQRLFFGTTKATLSMARPVSAQTALAS
jgi:TetR/AcrR family transcriptional repressor of nem operon